MDKYHSTDSRLLLLLKVMIFSFLLSAQSWWECHHQNYEQRRVRRKGALVWWRQTVTISDLLQVERWWKDFLVIVSKVFWASPQTQGCYLLWFYFFYYYPPPPSPPSYNIFFCFKVFYLLNEYNIFDQNVSREVALKSISVAGRVSGSCTILGFW